MEMGNNNGKWKMKNENDKWFYENGKWKRRRKVLFFVDENMSLCEWVKVLEGFDRVGGICGYGYYFLSVVILFWEGGYERVCYGYVYDYLLYYGVFFLCYSCF